MESLNFTPNSLDMFNNISNNNYSGNDDVMVEEGEDPAWVLYMDRTKMVMTVIGFLANIGTTITLMVNGQVGIPCILSNWGLILKNSSGSLST